MKNDWVILFISFYYMVFNAQILQLYNCKNSNVNNNMYIYYFVEVCEMLNSELH